MLANELSATLCLGKITAVSADIACGRETQGDTTTLEDLSILAKLRAGGEEE
jgi:hypothetical protein